MTETVLSAGALARLRAALAYLTPALKRLAEAILERPSEVIYQSVTELADLAQVGEASVIRLCRDLGFKGFQDFKLALAADLALDARAVRHETPESLADILENVTQDALRALQETRALLDLNALERVVAVLAEASSLLFFGAGASGVTARDYAYKFLRLGYSVTVYEDAHLAAMAAATLPQNAVMVGISRSGSTIDTVRALELAKARGVTTVALCQRAKSPATAVADHSLYTASSESPLTGGSIPSKMGQLLLLDALFAALLSRRPDAEAAIAATAKAVTDRNY